MAFVIVGAGAVGGLVGAALHSAGYDVRLVARGSTLDALTTRGLRLRSTTEDRVLRIRTVGSMSEADVSDGDVVLLSTKTQDTAVALESVRSSAGASTPVVCLQNGVENERLALRHFEHVYAAYVYVFATHPEPGVVHVHTSPSNGVIDVGRYPTGVDRTSEVVSGALLHAGFDSTVRTDVIRWKYAKLLANLSNAITALTDEPAIATPALAAAQREAVECFEAAAVSYVPLSVSSARRSTLMPLHDVAGQTHPGGSMWQSFAKHAPSIEVDYLNGEVVLLGRLHGIATPVNAVLQELSWVALRRGCRPGSLSVAELKSLVAALGNPPPTCHEKE